MEYPMNGVPHVWSTSCMEYSMCTCMEGHPVDSAWRGYLTLELVHCFSDVS